LPVSILHTRIAPSSLPETAQADVSPTHLSELENAEIAPGIDLVDRLARALGTTVADLLPASAEPDSLPVLKEHAGRLLKTLLEKGNRETFLKLNPILALLVEAAAKRG
jgi:transcriptional regulator with XRE-family HTH domain